MAAAKSLLFFSLLFSLPLAHGLDSCVRSNWTIEEFSELNREEIETVECRFVLALKEDCSFIGAMADSLENTEEYLRFLNNSSKNLNIVRYSTTDESIYPADIVSNDTAESSKWSLDKNFTSNSGCSDEATKILCTLLVDTADNTVSVNKMMCPDPTTTSIPSTTAVLETTKGRTVFTNEAVSAAPAKIDSVDETTASSGTKVGIHATIFVVLYFYQ